MLVVLLLVEWRLVMPVVSLSPHELGLIRVGLEMMADEAGVACASPRVCSSDRAEALRIERRVRSLLIRLGGSH